jgi:hypothetical protein
MGAIFMKFGRAPATKAIIGVWPWLSGLTGDTRRAY